VRRAQLFQGEAAAEEGRRLRAAARREEEPRDEWRQRGDRVLDQIFFILAAASQKGKRFEQLVFLREAGQLPEHFVCNLSCLCALAGELERLSSRG